jgi:hypothetical protein
MVEVECRTCGNRFRIPPELAKIGVRCQRCKTPVGAGQVKPPHPSLEDDLPTGTPRWVVWAAVAVIATAAVAALGFVTGYGSRGSSLQRTIAENHSQLADYRGKLESANEENKTLKRQLASVSEALEKALQPPPPPKDPLVGTWTGTYLELGGTEQTADRKAGKTWGWEIKDAVLTMKVPGGENSTVPWRVDRSKTPHSIDIGRRGTEPFEPVIVEAVSKPSLAFTGHGLATSKPGYETASRDFQDRG